MKKLEKNKFNFKDNAFLVALSAVVLGLAAGAIVMGALGFDPFVGFYNLFRGALMTKSRIGNTLALATTLMLVGLSVAFAFKTGLFNIGASGQILVGGLCATLVAHTVTAPRPVIVILLVLAAFAGGAIWGAIPGMLKAIFNVHEVVATIMMNWIAYWTVFYMVPGTNVLRNPVKETESASVIVKNSLRADWLTDLTGSLNFNYAFIVAIIAVIVIKFILDRTTLGFELKAVGSNKLCAEYAGIKVKRDIVISMAIAGGLAGLAGASYYTGYSLTMQIGVMPPQGFDGIAVALLGNSNPIGVVLSALFFGILQGGKGFMTAMTKVPPELADTIIATIIYFIATSVILQRFWGLLEVPLWKLWCKVKGFFLKLFKKEEATSNNGNSVVKKEKSGKAKEKKDKNLEKILKANKKKAALKEKKKKAQLKANSKKGGK